MKMKRALALLLSVVMMVGLCVPSFAAWDAAPDIELTAVKDGNEITVTVSPKTAAGLCSFEFDLTYPSDKVTLTSTKSQLQKNNSGFYVALDEEGEQKEDKAEIDISSAGRVGYAIALSQNTDFAKDAFISKIVFSIKDNVEGKIEFALTKLNVGTKGVGEKVFTEFPTAFVSIPMSSVNVALDAPAKGAALASVASADAYTAETVWYEGASASGVAVAYANAKPTTVYTAKVTLTPKTGYSFADTVTVSGFMSGAVQPASGALVLTKTFSETAGANALQGTVTVSGSAVYDETLTAVTDALDTNGEPGTPVWSYQWYRGDATISGATNASYKLTAADIGKTVRVRVTGSINSGYVESAPTAAVAKADCPVVPDAPIVESVTASTIRIEAVAANEYRCVKAGAIAVGGSDWKKPAADGIYEFTGLDADTAYWIYARVAETETHKASDSVYTEMTTEKKTVEDTVIAAITAYGGIYDGAPHDAVIVGAAANGYTVRFSLDGESWSEYVPQIMNAEEKDVYVQISREHYDTKTVTVTAEIKRATPVVGDFDLPALTAQTFGSTAAVTGLAPKDGVEGMGNVTVKYNGSTDVPVNAGEYAVTFDVALGMNYEAATGLVIGTLTVNRKTVTPAISDIAAVTFNGQQQKPEITVTGATLVKDTDYAVEYGANVNAGENAGSVTIKPVAASNYTFTNVTRNFTINQADAPTLTASGEQTLLSSGVVEGSKSYTFDLSGIVSGVPANAGTVTYAVKTEGSYTGTCTVNGTELSFTVAAAQAAGTADSVVLTVSSTNYKSADVTVSFKFKDKHDVNAKLGMNFNDGAQFTYQSAFDVQGTCSLENQTGAVWTYSYTGTKRSGAAYGPTAEKPTDAGSYTVTAAYEDSVEEDGIPGHIGTVTRNFTITPKTVTPAISDIAAVTYNKLQQKPEITVTGATLVKDTDYTVEYGTNVAAGTNAGSVTIKPVATSNYDFTQVTRNFTIQPKSVTITGLSAANKTYDGTTAATATGTAAVSGKIEGDTVSVSAGTAAFDTKNVGTGKTVTFTGYGLTGTDAANYVLSAQPESVTANITAKSVTITGLSAANKTYDGTTAATVTGTAVIDGMVNTDTVSVSAGTAAFDTKNVGTGKTVTFTGYSLTGADAANYSLSAQPANVSANVAAKELTLTDGTLKISKEYDGSTAAGTKSGSLGLTGVVSGETVSVTVGTVGEYDNKDYGKTHSVTLSGIALAGADAGNYTVSATYVFTKAEITKTKQAALVLPTIGAKTYGDASFTVTVTGGSGTGAYALTSSDSSVLKVTAQNGAEFTVQVVAAGSATLTADRAGDDNYEAAESASRSVTVNRRTAELLWSGADTRSYDGKASAVTAEVANLVSGDSCTVTVTGGTEKNAGSHTAVAESLSNANYELPEQASKTYVISKVVLTPAVSSVEAKTYDRTTAAAGTLSLTGAVNGEQPTATGSFAWTSAAAGTATVNVTGIALGSAWQTNYSLSAASLSSVTAPNGVKIAKKSVAIIDVLAADRSYVKDNTSVVLSGGALVGIVPGDSVSFTLGTGSVASDAVGADKAVTTAITLTGANAGNYVLTQPTDVTVSILAAQSVLNAAPDAAQVSDPTKLEGDAKTAAQALQTAIPFDAAVLQACANAVLANTDKVNAALSTAKQSEAVQNMLTTQSKTEADLKIAAVPFLVIEVKSAVLSGEARSITYEITAKYQFKATVAANGAAMTAANTVVIGEAQTMPVNSSITLTVPMPAGFVSAENVYVRHEHEGKTYYYLGSVSSNTLTVESRYGLSAFSPLPNMDPAASVDRTALGKGVVYFDTLQSAVDGVENGETVTLLKNETDGAAVAKTVSFTLDKQGFTCGSVTAAAGYTLSEKDGVYTVTQLSFGGSEYKITVADGILNGSVKTSVSTAGAGTTVTVTAKPDEGYMLEKLSVVRADGAEVELTQKSANVFSFKMPGASVKVTAAFRAGFADVAAKDYFHDAVYWAAGKGITTGTDATHFSPNADCTRAQAVTFLWRAAGSPVFVNMTANGPASDPNPFKDVSREAYYYNAVVWAVKNGITTGTDATHFSPDATCTRGQIVTFLWRAAGSPVFDNMTASGPASDPNPFKDVSADMYYYNAVVWAVKNGITTGTDAAHFSPDATCTRGQIVTFLYRDMVK